ncbi:MAG: ORF6N domain-containing protein [Prevotella sp.]|nr:ORF6N domain-containing protein [Prevotella sp.]
MDLQIEPIFHKIHLIRGQRVMLDYDLANLYGVETRVLNQAVKRNIERFEGDDFMFQLSKEEASEILKSQFVTSRWGGARKLPFAFTEMGVAMLSSVLRSKIAININRGIMRAFVEFRRMAAALPTESNDIKELKKEINSIKDYIEEILEDQNDINQENRMQLELVSQALAELQSERNRKPRRPIGFIQPDDHE